MRALRPAGAGGAPIAASIVAEPRDFKTSRQRPGSRRRAAARPSRQAQRALRRAAGELVEAGRWFDAQPELKAIVVRGAGNTFCAGADISAFGPADHAPVSREELRRSFDLGRRAADAIAGMRAITVAAIQGHCIGGGVVLAAACDIRIAAEDARFSIPEVDLGIPLAWGGIPRLVRELGPTVTKDLVLTCRPFDAAEAALLRFVSRSSRRSRC